MSNVPLPRSPQPASTTTGPLLDTSLASAHRARYALACTLAREAGHRAMTFFRARDTLQVEHKGLQDVVSRADREVEQFIRSGIAAAFPDDAFLGEESAAEEADGAADKAGKTGNVDTDRLTAGAAPALWVVDPIDGTTCFLQGMPVWCISIGVVIDGMPAIGAVYDPNADELFHAMHGDGAWLTSGSQGGDGDAPSRKPLSAFAGASFRDGPLGLGYSHKAPASAVVPFLSALLAEGGMFIRNGSGALMIAYVAAGRLIGYYEPFMHPWDCMAGFVLVVEAGGKAEDFLARGGLQRGNRVIVAGAGLFTSLQRMVEAPEAAAPAAPSAS